MAGSFGVPTTIASFVTTAGQRQGTWNGEFAYSASKVCSFCGEVFRPIQLISKTGTPAFPAKHRWEAQTCCSQSCAKKLKNPMHSQQARAKSSATRVSLGLGPTVRGGNGCPMPVPQQMLLDRFGNGWVAEFVVLANVKRGSCGLPTCYKIDLANKSLMLGIEIDGPSHYATKRKEQDAKKMDFLVMSGWSVYRVWNSTVLSLCSTCTSPDILLTSLKEYSYITAICRNQSQCLP